MTSDPQLARLVEEHVVAAALKEARIEAIARDGEWSADLDEGTLTVGGRTYAAELLGTQSAGDDTFLWGWEHPSAPEHRRGLARTVRDAGERLEVPALLELNPSVEVVDVMVAAVLGTGLAEGDAWWLAPNGPAIAALLVRDDALAAEPWSLVALPRLLVELTQALQFDAGRALAAFGRAPLPGIVPTTDETGAHVLGIGADHARIEVDEHGRIGAVELRIAGRPVAPEPETEPERRGLGRLFRRRR